MQREEKDRWERVIRQWWPPKNKLIEKEKKKREEKIGKGIIFQKWYFFERSKRQMVFTRDEFLRVKLRIIGRESFSIHSKIKNYLSNLSEKSFPALKYLKII